MLRTNLPPPPLVYVDKMSRYLEGLPITAKARRLAPKMAAMLFNYKRIQNGSKLVDRSTEMVGGRRAIRLVLAGKVNGKEEVYIAYFLGTAKHVYTLVYTAPVVSSSDSAKYRAECDSLIATFSFR